MENRKIDVLCVGLMVCDLILAPVQPCIFDADSSAVEQFTLASGGDALNAAINLGKLGRKVTLAGCVGIDPLGDFLIASAEKYGVHTGFVKRSGDCPTSTSVVLVEPSGERHFLYHGKANNALRLEDIDLNLLEQSRIVHVGSAMALEGLDGDGLHGLFRAAKAKGAATTMDVTWDKTGKWFSKIAAALPFTDIFMPSLEEAKLISGCEALDDIGSFFQKTGVKHLVVKLGKDGCFLTDFQETHFVPAFSGMNVVDTTGAGDAFVSGYLTGYLKNWSPKDCAVFGAAAAAISITGYGATACTASYDCVAALAAERYLPGTFHC